ncbi:MAG: lamin tail domain-containing protein, partial [Candidatus Aegiribacteria sp.]|nr:lamin tail domain-containing protein [Candidatus Aegiribacteria sp.]
ELEDAVSEDTYDDIADLDEFYDAIETLKFLPIERRQSSLQGQYNDCPRPFITTSNQTCASPDMFASWNHAFDPNGDPITYTVRLRRFTRPGYPDSTMMEYEGLTDTCITISGLPAGDYAWDVRAVSTSRYTVAFNQYMPFTVVLDYTELSGTLSGHTILTSENSPYVIKGNILIPSGSTVIIEPGVMLRFNEGCSMICQGNLYMEGSPGDSVVFCANMQNEPWGGIALLEPDSRVNTFKYVSISGGTAAYWQGNDYHSVIYASDAEILIENSSFFSNEDCLYLDGCSVVIRNSDFSGRNKGGSLILYYGKSALIEDTVFGNMYDTGSIHGDALRFQNCEDGEFIISRCTFYNIDGEGAGQDDAVQFHECENGEFIIRECLIYNIDGDGIDSNNSILSIEDNLIYNCTDKGISLGKGTSGTGIPTNAVISGNIVFNCYTGIAVKDDSYAEITGCTISSCDIGVRAYNKTTGSGGGNATVINSIFDSNSTIFSIEDGSVVSVNYSLTGSSEPWTGEGNIAGDPEFADWDSLDWHLSYTSPCIDTGSPLIEDPDGTRSDMGAVFFPQVFEGLVINEIQSVNDTTIADSYGEYDDWFEIYNGSGYDCDLSWLYISDDPSDLGRYQFPVGTVIPSGEFLVVWADEHPWQNGCHLPFALSGDGDSLYISRQPAESRMNLLSPLENGVPRLIDFKYFGAIQPDRSLGRVSDGGSEWSILEYCTPGWSNSIPCSDIGYLQVSSPFPNPVFSGLVALDITVDAGQTVVSVYDLAGRLVDVIMDRYLETGEHRLYWDTIQGRGGHAPTGVYLIHVRHAAGLSESRKIVILNQ